MDVFDEQLGLLTALSERGTVEDQAIREGSMTFRLRAVSALLCAGAFIAGAGCSGGSSPSAVSGEPEGSEVFETEAPAPEDTGATQIVPTGGEEVSVELPGLPVGGGASEVSEALQCAPVSWSGPSDFPEGLVITITAVSFDPAEAFALSSETCAAEPCLDSSFELTPDTESCEVPVTWTDAPSDFGSMSVAGSASCPPEHAVECQAFLAGLGSGSIQLVARPGDEEETSDGSSPSEPSSESTDGAG